MIYLSMYECDNLGFTVSVLVDMLIGYNTIFITVSECGQVALLESTLQWVQLFSGHTSLPNLHQRTSSTQSQQQNSLLMFQNDRPHH